MIFVYMYVFFGGACGNDCHVYRTAYKESVQITNTQLWQPLSQLLWLLLSSSVKKWHLSYAHHWKCLNILAGIFSTS